MKGDVFIALAGALIVAAAVIFFQRNIAHKQSPTYRETLLDSLATTEQKIIVHHDSALFYAERRKKYEFKIDSLNNLDSLGWADLRARYSADLIRKLESEIRPGSTGFGDTIRVSQARSAQPETRKRAAAKGKSDAPDP